MEGNAHVVVHSACPDDPTGQYVPMTLQEVRAVVAPMFVREPQGELVVDSDELENLFQVHCFPGGRKGHLCRCGNHVCSHCGADCGKSASCPECGHQCNCGKSAKMFVSVELARLGAHVCEGFTQ